jgi:hypothetical protein
MLGEYDLNPGGRLVRPGRRLTSMMAPSLVLGRHGPRAAVAVGLVLAYAERG